LQSSFENSNIDIFCKNTSYIHLRFVVNSRSSSIWPISNHFSPFTNTECFTDLEQTDIGYICSSWFVFRQAHFCYFPDASKMTLTSKVVRRDSKIIILDLYSKFVTHSVELKISHFFDWYWLPGLLEYVRWGKFIFCPSFVFKASLMPYLVKAKQEFVQG